MIFELAKDFSDAMVAMPTEHPKHRMLELLEEAVRRDIHFIDRHPTTLFQCMWNTCWWYDCPEATMHYEKPEDIELHNVPWLQAGPKLHNLLQNWRDYKQSTTPAGCWIRSLRPPEIHLGTAQKAILAGHNDSVISVMFSSDSKRIITGSKDGTVRVWDAVIGSQINIFSINDINIKSIGISPCDNRAASGSINGVVRLLDICHGKVLKSFRAHKDSVNSLTFSADGSKIITGSSDKSIRIWNAESGEEIGVFLGSKGFVSCVAISPSGDRLVSGGSVYDNTIRIWNVLDYHLTNTLYWGNNYVTMVIFSPDGSRIASGHSDGTIRIWDAGNGLELAVLQRNNSVESIAYSPDGSLIASGHSDGIIQVWNASNGTKMELLEGHEKPVVGVAFSPSSDELVSGSMDETACLWKLSGDSHLRILHGDNAGINLRSIRFNANGNRIISVVNEKSSFSDQKFVIWDVQNGSVITILRADDDNTANSPDGVNMAYIVKDETQGNDSSLISKNDERKRKERTQAIRLLNIKTGKSGGVLCINIGEKFEFSEHIYSPCGTLVAARTYNGHVHLWNIHNHTEIPISD